jgi:protein TonB
VFSAWPNAFGKREVSALQVIAGRIAESNREAETGISAPAMSPELPAEPSQTVSDEIPLAEVSPAEVPSDQITGASTDELIELEEESAPLAVESAPRRPFDVWGVVLVVLVIAAALLLGVLLGWRRAAEFAKQSAQVPTSNPANPTPPVSTAPAQVASAAEENGALATPGDTSIKKAPRTAPPAGGLLVTQNGKVVYRSSPEPAPRNAKESGEHSLIRKVDPEYPAEAKARHVQGPVVLDVEVLHDGSVGTVAIVSGDPLLAQSAIDAVKQWRYQPEAGEGQGLERRTRVTVNFKLPES